VADQGSPPGGLANSDIPIIVKSALWTLLAAVVGASLTALADTLITTTFPELRDRGLIDATLFTLLTTLVDAFRKAVQQWLKDTRPISIILLACLLALPAGDAMAGETAVVVDDSKPATYLVTVAADGSVSVNPIRVVRSGAPLPGPTPTPTPGTPTAFTKAVQGLTKAALDSGATPTTAAALSSVYSLVSSGVKDGSIPEAVALPAIKAATDTIMLNVADRDKWTKWRTDLSVALETLRQQGVLKIPDALTEVAAGIDLALGRSINPRAIVGMTAAQQGVAVNTDKLFENIDLAKLIELIKLILELLKIFRPM
jgi:hypothetical protein